LATLESLLQKTPRGGNIMQEIAWQASLVLMALVAFGFVYVAINSGNREADFAPLQKRAYRLRTRLFWGLALTFGPTMIYTLISLPYDAAHAREGTGGTAQVIRATGHLWYWELSDNEVEVNRPVEFQVTSADVNHGFGIYDTNMRLIAQVQAMPGYVNTLKHTFSKEGSYKILCLEYCGTVHHSMIAELKVVKQ
jgi:cytochrome c oxidase subunit II